MCADEVSAVATPVLWAQKQPRQSFLMCQSAEALYENIATNRWICFKQSAPATRLGEQTYIAYSRWGRINALLNAEIVDTVNLAIECLFKKG